MNTTQPIRNTNDIYRLKQYFLNSKLNIRNYALFVLGINCALRISDLLSLKWHDVFIENSNKFRNHITLNEQKTKKLQVIALNANAKDALFLLYKSTPHNSANDYIFYGRKEDTHLSRSQAFRIIRDAARELSIGPNISCHSLRKTFGYHAWQNGVQPVMLMEIFNHSSFEITRRYLGIEQEEKDAVFLSINL